MRTVITLLIPFLALGSGQALAIDFGDDASEYAKNNACDDMRFEGKGMTGGPLVAEDMMHDATDCRTFYEAGKLNFSLEGEFDFGRDSGQWANDGECDDPRFDGPGMTASPLLAEDIRADATDCQTAWAEGRLWARGGGETPQAGLPPSNLDFGNDTSQWARDGECDDPRFEGEGMTSTPLLDTDLGTDATDCQTAFAEGRIRLRGEGPPIGVSFQGVDFGDDTSQWSNDGECDDPRFRGEGMTTTPLQDADRGKDATDCLTAFQTGTVFLRPEFASSAPEPKDRSLLQFGVDGSQWANDGECDDPRFEGQGMTSTPLLDEDIGQDATDCEAAFQAKRVALKKGASPALGPGKNKGNHALVPALNFGDDSSQWARDGECDDPRFEGKGMTDTTLLQNDVMRDASDCSSLFEAGQIRLRLDQ
ncbi:MAG: hypothetical protein AAF679_08335 [Pseudomonadota bacterium]